jgi:hypothetical protein
MAREPGGIASFGGLNLSRLSGSNISDYVPMIVARLPTCQAELEIEMSAGDICHIPSCNNRCSLRLLFVCK